MVVGCCRSLAGQLELQVVEGCCPTLNAELCCFLCRLFLCLKKRKMFLLWVTDLYVFSFSENIETFGFTPVLCSPHQ